MGLNWTWTGYALVYIGSAHFEGNVMNFAILLFSCSKLLGTIAWASSLNLASEISFWTLFFFSTCGLKKNWNSSFLASRLLVSQPVVRPRWLPCQRSKVRPYWGSYARSKRIRCVLLRLDENPWIVGLVEVIKVNSRVINVAVVIFHVTAYE